jgi:hypothetical protein
MAQGAQVTPLIAFGTVNTGSSSTNIVTLTNNGSTNTTISQVSASGGAFSATGITTPYTLPVGGTVTLSITFAPQAAAGYSGAVTVTSNAANSPLNIALSGTGTQAPQAQLSATPASESFGNINVGTTATRTITLINNGNASATISQVGATGAGFSISGLSTPYTLAAGATTSFKVSFLPASAGSYTGRASVVSSAPNSPTTVALSGTGVTATSSTPICGQVNDKQVHLPPNYDTFMPPASGQSYVDPVFGCTVTRVTDGTLEQLSDGSHPGLMNSYSTVSPLNASDTTLFVLATDGSWSIRGTNGNVIVPSSNIPGFSGHPVWDASNGNLFYYALGNRLYGGTISGSSISASVLHTFSEYSAVTSMDMADLSQDADHIALVGQNANGTMDVFVWSISQTAKTSIYKTVCTGSVAGAGQPGCLHKLQLTANNLLSIQFNNDGSGTEQGVRLWNGSTLVHLQDRTGHYDTGNDLNGNPVFVSLNNSYTLSSLSNPCPSGWGLDVAQLSNLNSAVCALDNVPYWHISYRGGASQPWIAFSFFDSRTPGPEYFTTDANYRTISTSNWQLYEDEIVVGKVDGSSVYRLAHARSRSMESYWAQPHAAISRDGKYIVFSSDMAHPNGCPANMHVANDCSDIYMIKIQ